MNLHLPRHSATDAGLFLAGLAFCAAAAAAPAGTVTHLSGPLVVHTADGHTKVVAMGATVEAGDTLFTGHGAYAQVRFADRSSAILEPDTQLAIDAFDYDESRTQADHAAMTLTEGGLELTSGAIAARSPGRHTLATPLGTIEVTRSKFIVSYSPLRAGAVASLAGIHLAALSMGTLSDAPTPPLVTAQAVPLPNAPGGGLSPGLYVHVIDGLINLSNKGGSQSFAAGQFGYTASLAQPPVVVPANPGIKFTPPPTFSAPPTAGSSSGNKSGAVDCEVR